MSRTIAVIGAGPSGFYAVDGLVRALPDARIDIIDRLPCPYGLVRYGVAPDHQGTKAVQRQFERLLAKPTVRFIGNVEVGRDVTIEDLAALYDALIIATGCSHDRRLGIPGEELDGVVGSGAFVGWYNGHPDFADLDPVRPDMRTVAVIGAGNVAIDVARVLAKTADEMAKSDIAPQAAAAIAELDLTDVSLIARRGPADANFTGNELAELGRLAAFQAIVQPGLLEGATAADSDPAPERMRKTKNLEILRGFATSATAEKHRRLHFLFRCTPVALHGVDGKVRELELADTRHPERRWRLLADLVVTCIGYDPSPPAGLPLEHGHITHDDGRVRGLPATYVVGWAKRGPTGVIPTNRADSLALVKVVVDDLTAVPASQKAGPAGLDELLAARGTHVIDTAAWQRIEAAENIAGQTEGRPRIKLGAWRLLELAARGVP